MDVTGKHTFIELKDSEMGRQSVSDMAARSKKSEFSTA